MSVFLDIPAAEWVASNALAFAVRDRYPVSPGHTLVITRRVVADWFSASDEERAAVFELVETVKRQLDAELHPDGYNVGFNAGAAAGQTVPHLHVHVIPRYRGDMDDPRGGVRHVIPSKGNYLRSVAPLAAGGAEDPFSRHVLPLFETAHEIAIVAAFVQASGLHRIKAQLRAAVSRGASVRVLTGDYLDITQVVAFRGGRPWRRLRREQQPVAVGPRGRHRVEPSRRSGSRLPRVRARARRLQRALGTGAPSRRRLGRSAGSRRAACARGRSTRARARMTATRRSTISAAARSMRCARSTSSTKASTCRRSIAS